MFQKEEREREKKENEREKIRENFDTHGSRTIDRSHYFQILVDGDSFYTTGPSLLDIVCVSHPRTLGPVDDGGWG